MASHISNPQNARILSMKCHESNDSYYRIQIGTEVKYVTIKAGFYAYNILSSPSSLLKALLAFKEGSWTRMTISWGPASIIMQEMSLDPMPSVETVWHHNLVNVLSLIELRPLHARVCEVEYKGATAIAKIARFPWEIKAIENETEAYYRLAKSKLVPRFLGHLTEEGRVMGFLLERVEGRFARIDDLPTCKRLARRIHRSGMLHGDLNRYNFVIGESRSWILDFESASEYNADLAHEELMELDAQLVEETGRGRSYLVDTGVEAT